MHGGHRDDKLHYELIYSVPLMEPQQSSACASMELNVVICKNKKYQKPYDYLAYIQSLKHNYSHYHSS